MSVINDILGFLFPPSPEAELVAATHTEDILEQLHPHEHHGAMTLLLFSDPLVRALIHQAKFHADTRAQELLGSVLARYVEQHHPTACVVPIPLSHARLRERGYNQVERIITHAAEQTDAQIHTATLLIRTRHTTPQTELSREKRSKNVAGAFGTGDTSLPKDTPIILVDDVTTTGATLKEAAAALRAAGYTDVSTLALAH